MFSSLVSRMFSSSKNVEEPNYFYFENTRSEKKEKTAQIANNNPSQTTAEKLQRTPVTLPSINECHTRLFYDYLFGISDKNSVQDDLTPFITAKIEELLARPVELLKALPPLPNSLNTIIQQANKEDFDTDELIDILEHEPFVAAKVIELANSVHYNKSDKAIVDLKSAFMLLGTKGLIEGVVTGFVNRLTPSNTVYFKHYGEKIWQHSVKTAEIAKELVAKSDCKNEKSQAYLTGLLNNLGNMIIFQLLVEAFSYVHPDSHPNSLGFKSLMFKYSKRLTYYIAKSWHFPNEILNVLAKQVSLSNPAMLNAFFQQHPITSYVYEANILAEVSLLIEDDKILADDLEQIRSVFRSTEAQEMFETLTSSLNKQLLKSG